MRVFLLLCVPLLCISCGAGKRTLVSTQLAPHPSAAPEADIEDREDSYDEAADFYVLKRAPDGRHVPAERYREAQRHAARMPAYSLAEGRIAGAKKLLRESNLGAWRPLGPGNVGGRTRALVIHPSDPNIMYAGSVGGGVWKTTDGGASWLPLSDLLPSIGISTLAMDPQNPDTLYAGTGEFYTNSVRGDSIRGLGIFKTTDGGATWTQIPFTATSSSFYYVNKIVISPNNSQRIYAATYGGVWASGDGGVTWQRTLARTSPATGCQDLAIRTDQSTDYLFAACGTRQSTQTAIFRNQDAAGAGVWESVLAEPNMDRTSLALAPSNQNIIYAMSANAATGEHQFGLLAVYRSSSSGDSGSWEKRASGQDDNRINAVLLTNPREAFGDVCTSGGKATYSNQGEYDSALTVDPLNPDVVWAGGIGTFRSDDGGRNWGIAAFWQANAPQLAHSDVHAIVFAPGYNGNDNQTLFTASDGGIYRTDNALADTATGERAACAPYPTKVEWKNVNNGYAVTQFYHGAVVPGGGAYAGGAQDNGTNRGSDALGPNDWRRLLGGDGGYVAIDPKDPSIWYGESQHLAFVKSTSYGLSFAAATRGITGPSGSGGDFPFITPFVMDPADSKRLYLGGKSLWRTADGAQNWMEVSARVPSANGLISAIAISAADPNRVLYGTSTGHIYRSANALAADKTTIWDVTQPRTGYLSHLEFDPSNPDIVYATYSQFKSSAAQNHIYRSSDGGATWTGIDGSGDTGIPDIPVFTVLPDPLNPATLYLGTDIGVFVSIDGGTTWARDDNPFANAVTETLVLDRGAGQSTLFAFTHGRGVWKVALPGSGDPCQYNVSPASAQLPAFGGTTLTFNVTTSDNCSWSAIPFNGGWTPRAPAAGAGNGLITLPVTQNNTAQPRVASIVVQDKSITIQQDAAQVAAGNDDKASPFVITGLPAVVIENTGSATESGGDPVHSCTKSADSKTLWFKVTAPDTGTLSLGFANRRADTGSDSGTLMTVYNAAGAEIACSLTPQNNTLITTRTPMIPVKQGDVLLIEVSATTFNAPAGAQLLRGNLTLTASMRP